MNQDSPITISQLKAITPGGWTASRFLAQVDSIFEKTTKDGKPFREIHLVDVGDKCVIRIWSDASEYLLSASLSSGQLIEITSEIMTGGAFGPEFRRWKWRELTPEERSIFLVGSEEIWQKREADWTFLSSAIAQLEDPRLARVCSLFLEDHQARFQRTAAARSYHHARRGGLLEHTSQMMKAALALATVYPQLNRDLLVAGVLFHDSGKMWENAVSEESFSVNYTEAGELMGHITLGIELLNLTWRKMREAGELDAWAKLKPASEQVRLHLIHLIASHHGTHEYGSPVVPKTPEAFVLHYVDNLDAKLESLRTGYAQNPLVAPRIHERSRPLNVNLIDPLPVFSSTPEESKN